MKSRLKWKSCVEHGGRHLYAQFEKLYFKIALFYTDEWAQLTVTTRSGRVISCYVHDTVRLAKQAARRRLPRDNVSWVFGALKTINQPIPSKKAK